MSPYSQVFGLFPYKKKDETRKVIALSFDDGPNEPYTNQIVEFLDSQNIKGTFFQVARAVQKNPDLTKKMMQSGHIIGNHSLSHKFQNYFLHPYFRQELEQSQDIFTRVLGVEPTLFRPPWLFRTPLILTTAKQYKLFPISGLFCSNLEVLRVSPSWIARVAVRRARPGRILIFHDGYNGKGAKRSETVSALKMTVSALQKQGYEFVTVSELFNIRPYS